MAERFTQVRKRDGALAPFEGARIERAVNRAQREVMGRADEAFSRRVLRDVLADLAKTVRDDTPTVEEIQDAVERALVAEGRADLAKAYILYRRRHADLRDVKRVLGVKDDLKLSLNAVRILEQRYLARDAQGRTVETPSEMFRRVARAVAAAEEKFRAGAAREYEERFYRLMASLDFLPNSPTLMNAGRELGQLSACFVLPVEDSMEGIFDALKYMALIHQSGGGTGFSFSRLRPRGARVRSTGGIASGPNSFMQIFDRATDVIKQGGRRRGANMAVLRVDHPDINEFILAKASNPNILRNFNVSVAATDEFMRAVREEGDYAIRDPISRQEIARRSAPATFSLIASAAWQCGDPGLIFIDEINRRNPLADVAQIEATNPCGEQPLLPYESCNLGSINLCHFVRDGALDRERLGEVVDLAVRFLDDVIEVNRYPIEPVRSATLASRKIGLGLMGFADALYLLGIPYDSEEGLRFAEEVMGFVNERAHAASELLGAERGPFPLFERSTWKARGFMHLRNATCTTVAPTGTIGLIAGCSSGIEPVFALRYWRRMAEGPLLIETHPIFEEVARRRGLDLDELFRGEGARGSIRQAASFPEDLRRVFVVARDIAPEWHVRMQAAFQRHCDSGVSKTVNLPHSATVEDVARTYMLAYELGCKGITVYREGSREEDLLRTDAVAAGAGELPSCAEGDLLSGIGESGARCRCP